MVMKAIGGTNILMPLASFSLNILNSGFPFLLLITVYNAAK